MNLKKVFRGLVYLNILVLALYVARFYFFPVPVVGVVSTTLLELVFLLTFVIWISSGLYKQVKIDKLLGFLFLVVVLGFLQIFVSPDLRGGIGAWRAFILEPVLFFVILRTAFDTKERVLSLVRYLLYSAAPLAIFAIFQAVFPQFFAVYIDEMGRGHAWFSSPNFLAMYLAPVCLFGFLLLRSRNEVLLMFLCFTGLASTLSRGALLGILIALLVYLAFKWKGKIVKFWVGGLLAVTFIAFILFAFVGVQRINPNEHFVERPEHFTTMQVRFCLWEGTSDLLRSNFIFGAGLSGFKTLYARDFTTCDSEPLAYPHNIFLNFWAELGLLGLIMILAFYLYLLYALKPSNRLQLSAFIVFIYYWFHGLVDVPYFKNDLSFVFLLSFFIFYSSSLSSSGSSVYSTVKE